jgi:hypothetical protein
MLKANESVSNKNRQLVSDAIKKATGRDDYTTVYGYGTKNLLIIQLTTHYAVGFNKDEVVAIEIDKSGNTGGELMKFTKSDEIKFNLHGKLKMSNRSNNVKMDVPGMVPTIVGTKQLGINQMDEMSALIQAVETFKK